jgi:hypothetical protein
MSGPIRVFCVGSHGANSASPPQRPTPAASDDAKQSEAERDDADGK